MRSLVQMGSVSVGEEPRVVGTVATGATLRGLAEGGDAPCDIVEVRLDLVGVDEEEWWRLAAAISARRPVLLTIRSAAEGGAWEGDAAEWLRLYTLGLRHVDAIDIERRSELAPRLVAEARGLGKAVVLSHHDFEKTPPLEDLERIVRDMAAYPGAVVKVATLTETEEEVERLEALLRSHQGPPLCVLGMGRLGRRTRVAFPAMGSCLTYGYLDEAAAPGQWPCRELRRAMRET